MWWSKKLTPSTYVFELLLLPTITLYLRNFKKVSCVQKKMETVKSRQISIIINNLAGWERNWKVLKGDSSVIFKLFLILFSHFNGAKKQTLT